ncbi:MAG: hypothetical protein QXX09_00555 [Candidatus Methanomethylicia archaeon]
MRIYVKTPARLHMGLIDLRGDLGRVFGGIGVGIDHPNVVLEVQPCEKLSITGEKTILVKSLVERFIKTYSINGNFSVHVKEVIPEHVGLGSVTQLALALAVALAKLFDIKASIRELAASMGRGLRSGIGVAVFEGGGFIVDGGRTLNVDSSVPGRVPPVIFRQPFPEDWVLIIAIPNNMRGLTEDEEKIAFKNLPPMPAEDIGRICRLIVMKLLPSLMEHDIEGFGYALTNIQIIVGDYFAKVQGGRYCNPLVTEGIELLQKLGAYGVGQSSWGPTFYGVFKDGEWVRGVQRRMQIFLEERGGGKVFITRANNRGAYIKIYEN